VEQVVSFARMCNLIFRWEKVKDRMPKILASLGQLWVFSNPADPWGSKELISWDVFEAMVIRAEAEALEKKGPGKEVGVGKVKEA
jgi:hypothetical protein